MDFEIFKYFSKNVLLITLQVLKSIKERLLNTVKVFEIRKRSFILRKSYEAINKKKKNANSDEGYYSKSI